MRNASQGALLRTPSGAAPGPPRRMLLLLWGFLFLALAGAVFTWGLQYKLSLYDGPHAPSHAMPVAKLLSQNEQSNVAEKVFFRGLAPAGKIPYCVPAIQFRLSLLLLSGIAIAIAKRSSGLPRNERPRASGYLDFTTFFLRPPPFLS
jgi:hypothetical protein